MSLDFCIHKQLIDQLNLKLLAKAAGLFLPLKTFLTLFQDLILDLDSDPDKNTPYPQQRM